MAANNTTSEPTMQKLLPLFIAFILAACAEFPGVYKVDIEQGNILTQEMLGKLEVGQTKEQVLFVLGSPLIDDTFTANRWDYSYRLKKGDKFLQNANLVLLFKDNLLASFTNEGVTRKK